MKKLILILSVFLININYVNGEELNCTTTLKKGIKGETVKTLQIKLNEAMNCNLKVDGIYGSKTRKCVINFQSQNNLNETGTVNKKTCKKLNEITNDASNEYVDENNTNNIKEVQENLNKITNCNLKVDGIYGNKTKKCVTSFQKQNDFLYYHEIQFFATADC